MLELIDVSVSYGPVDALRSVSMRVAPGEILAVLGPNGAGKSTLVNCISRLVPMKKGRILFEGRDISNLTAAKAAREGIIQCPEGRRLFTRMTVGENLRVAATLKGMRSREFKDSVDELAAMFPVLKERWKQQAGTLSGGEQQMVAFARSLMAKPRILLLDEPGLGLAPVVVKQVFQAIRQIAKSGISIVLVEQNVRAALKVSDRAYVLRTGGVVAEGMPGEIQAWFDKGPGYLGKISGDGGKEYDG